MNWGKGIIGGMILFMLFILSMCVYMFASPADDYDHQYYEKGLSFNRDYEHERQVFKDNAQPLISVDACCVKLTFPQAIKGQVKFIRQSNAANDKSFAINNNNGQPIEVLTANMPKGKWRLVIDWTSSNKGYLYQKDIFIK